jgi:hypothetical protein
MARGRGTGPVTVAAARSLDTGASQAGPAVPYPEPPWPVAGLRLPFPTDWQIGLSASQFRDPGSSASFCLFQQAVAAPEAETGLRVPLESRSGSSSWHATTVTQAGRLIMMDPQKQPTQTVEGPQAIANTICLRQNASCTRTTPSTTQRDCQDAHVPQDSSISFDYDHRFRGSGLAL